LQESLLCRSKRSDWSSNALITEDSSLGPNDSILKLQTPLPTITLTLKLWRLWQFLCQTNTFLWQFDVGDVTGVAEGPHRFSLQHDVYATRIAHVEDKWSGNIPR